MSNREKISEGVLQRLGKAEIRAVASDRGYKIGDGGKGTLIGRFLAEQDKDTTARVSGEEVDSAATTEELDQFTKDTVEESHRQNDGRQPSTQNPPSPVRENPVQSEPASAPAPTSVPTNAPTGNPTPAKPVQAAKPSTTLRFTDSEATRAPASKEPVPIKVGNVGQTD